MSSTPTDHDLERRAKQRADMKMGFYVHALVYVLVNGGLFVLAMAGDWARWQAIPMAAWGLGLAIHGLVVFVSLRGGGLRERMLAQEIERLKSGR